MIKCEFFFNLLICKLVMIFNDFICSKVKILTKLKVYGFHEDLCFMSLVQHRRTEEFVIKDPSIPPLKVQSKK